MRFTNNRQSNKILTDNRLFQPLPLLKFRPSPIHGPLVYVHTDARTRYESTIFAGHLCEHTFPLVRTPESGHSAHAWVQGLDLRLSSDLVPKHGTRERLLMGTNVTTPFFQVPTPSTKSRPCRRALNWVSTCRVPSI